MRCQHPVLVRAQVRERTVAPGDHAKERTAPLAITYGRSKDYKSFFSLELVASATPEPNEPHGVLEAFVCRSCGFVEWYAQAPEQIPIGVVFGTELVDMSGAGPFR